MGRVSRLTRFQESVAVLEIGSKLGRSCRADRRSFARSGPEGGGPLRRIRSICIAPDAVCCLGAASHSNVSPRLRTLDAPFQRRNEGINDSALLFCSKIWRERLDVVELRYEALKRYRLAAEADDEREKARFRAEGDLFSAKADSAVPVSQATEELCPQDR